MMEFTNNDWVQRDIIHNIIILTKIVTYTIHAVILTKYQKYLSTTILKHVNVLDKVNKLSYGRLHHMKPHDSYSISIHVRTVTLAEISHKQKE